jgi:hypothetical protein
MSEQDETVTTLVAARAANSNWFFPDVGKAVREAFERWLEEQRREAAEKTPPGGAWMKFDTWAPDSLHWYAPSDITIWPDGKVIIRVRTLSNQRNTSPIGNGGRAWSFWCDFSTYRTLEEAEDFSKKLSLHPFHVATLEWKQERHFIETEYHDPRIGAAIAACGAYSVERKILKVHQDGRGDALIPKITRPWNP